MNSNSGLKQNKINALIWLLVLLLGLFILVKNSHNIKIESSLTTLLQKKEAIPSQVDKHLSSTINDAIIWLVSAKQLDQAKQSATKFTARLATLTGLSDIQARNVQQQRDWQHYFFNHRAMLFSAELQAKLSQPEAYFDYIQAQLYSPFAGVSNNELQQDPLLLTRQQLLQQKQRLQIDDGWVYAQSEGNFYLLIRAKTNAQGLTQKAQLVQQLQQIQQTIEQETGSKIYARGAIFFSDASAQSVERDIKIIGIGSLIGIILLLLFAFRHFYPLCLLVFSLLSGVLFGILATWLYFGEIHLLTLGLSSCLIGVSADYSLHFITHRFYPEKANVSSRQTLLELRSALILAFATTALCYAIMLLLPLVILQQMAIFAIFGLFGALLTVILCYPLFTQTIQPLKFSSAQSLTSYLQGWKNSRWSVPIAIILFFASLCFSLQVKVSDDVRLLQNKSATLLANEQIITRVLQQNNELQYFIVQADSVEQLLKNITNLTALLRQEKYQNVIIPAVSLDGYIQDIETQQQNYQQVDLTLQQLSTKLSEFNPQIITTYPKQLISFTDFLASPIGKNFSEFYQQYQNKHYFLLPLTKSNSKLSKVIADQQIDVSYHNITEEWSNLFQQSREGILYILLFSIVVVFLLLSWFLTWRYAFAIVAVLILAMSVATAALTITGQYFNLFATLALILLLGMGIDYGIFMAKQGKQFADQMNNNTLSAFVAIILSALTTLLSFGLLMLSETQALVSFATVLCIGISTVFIFIPLVLKVHCHNK
ncbi:hypothetical protein QV08_10070 [Gallibacterium salpingitidis]|uniref:Membrane transport protein MMPL domain-containing protein n=1 Tax=Gallibacterium salpingitidis TaxID=505341 RepID=A0A1A7PXJ1_9PAST|nr:MMPL family transporter [Gallibacterium salpingitidis]OBW96436.1 hypothetical protein QS62_00390 [Gallibacterium salpingitidis]OBX06471.1 hypothetical protein QV08_10070 [Gallibacterium salpingitidis]OBX08902.1 hypothetical protein QV09_09235 [Gallibacterium salpingitidis]WKS99411.1 MMPL family transporter [Gallibacterium salpingitidis]